tara:strand:+ start:375 stop:602 length:228 start_codon:yes stop_codon:yes gene_type:complete
MLVKSEEGINSMKRYYTDKKTELLAAKKSRVKMIQNPPPLGKKNGVEVITKRDFVTERMNMTEILQGVNWFVHSY